MKRLFLVLLVFGAVVPCLGEAPYNAMGEMAGEVGLHSVILQTRLTAFASRDSAGVVPGAEGWVSFELSSIDNFSDSRFTPWRQATLENDFIVKERVAGLSADTPYFYRVHIGESVGRSDRLGPRRSFRTAPEPDLQRDVSFTVVTSHKYTAVDHPDGYNSYAAMTRLRPDFIICTGDNVYYDSDSPPGVDLKTCRNLWHRTFSLPRLVTFYGLVPAYWEKDDHDYRFDDADPYMPNHNPYQPDLQPGSVDDETGRRIFLEQVPVGNRTYRTVRWGSALQVWLTEGRDFRSPNDMPDGPGKTMWGIEQRRWLKRTILESKALFKVMVSPSPLLGPDRSDKKDNQANRLGFFTEGQNFLKWLAENKVRNFYIVCGDRHWKYRSVHLETGLEEFCCGALGDGSSVKNPDYSDPAVERKFYLGNGGFLLVRVKAERVSEPAIVFDLCEQDGRAAYSVRRPYKDQ
ncbi:MAG TPA: alkaline phosphatase D family protein [archaeon]|nr:alkaline phosphatase D family protein [archaeon]